MAGVLSVREVARGPGRRMKRFEDVQKRLKRPMRGGGHRVVAHIMRIGGGSVSDQFRTQTYFSQFGARVPWKRTKPFGTQPAPRRTLDRTGALKRAWTGGTGSVTRHTDVKVQIGVDQTRFPQAGRLQSTSATLTRPVHMGARGRTKMHWYLGMKLGVWISDRRLMMGLKVQPRRLGVNPEMMKRISVGMEDFLLTGKAAVARNV